MRRIIKVLGYIGAAAALLYCGYWYVAAATIVSNINSAFSQRNATAEVSLGNVEILGFPTDFDVKLQDVSVNVKDNFSWSTSGVRLVAASLEPTRLDIDLSRPHAIAGRWGDMELDTERAQVIALFGKNASLPLQDLRFALEGAELNHADGFAVAAESVIAVIKNLEGKDRGVYRLETEIIGADISKLFPGLPESHQRLGPISGVLDVLFTSAWEAGDLPNKLPAFQGTRLQKLSAEIGRSAVALAGTLQFNSNKTVSGEVTLTVTNWRDLLSVAKEMGKIDAEGEEIFAEMLTDVEALSSKPGILELPLVIKNGAVTYGIFTIGLIPPIH